MKNFTSFLVACLIMVCFLTSVTAQTPQKFNYQAIARDSAGAVIANQPVSFIMTIRDGGPSGTDVYHETHEVSTNMYGLVNLEIGDGTDATGIFADISWASGNKFLEIQLDADGPAGGYTYTIVGSIELLSVPYALHAKTAENGFSGNYNDLTNTPIIPTTVSQLANDAGYLTSFTEVDGSITNELQVLSIRHDTVFLTNGGFAKLPAGFDGQYNSLTGTPTNVSDFTNDAGYLNSFTEVDGSITNEIQILSISNDTVFLTNGGFAKLPAGFDGQYSSLTGVPTNVSTFTNDAGYLTSYSETDPEVGTNATNYLSKWNGTELISSTVYDNGKVGIGTPNPEAALDITSTTSGILIPRMTTAERDLIAAPVLGLQIFNTTTKCFNVWLGSSWGQLCPDCGIVPVAGNNGPICAGLTLNLTAVTIPGAIYSWTGPNGFTSALQNPDIPNATTAASGAYYVTATVAGCTSLPSTTVATVTPSLGATSAGYNNPVCTGSTLNFTATTIAGASYTWSGPNNYFSNIQNPSIPNVQTSAAGTYYVVATVGNCSSSTSVDITIDPIPAQPGVIAGTNSILPPQTAVSYSITPVAGADDYTWAYSGTGATITGQGTSAITIDFACGATGGNVTVTANNLCGGTSPVQSRSVIITTLAQPGAITGTTPVVPPQVGITYSTTPVTGASSYTWTVPASLGTIVSGQGTTSITVDFACGAIGGLISVLANNACGSSSARTMAVSMSTIATPGTISGPGTITFPQTGVVYSVAAVPYASTYTWTVPTGAIIASGQGSNVILVDYACGAVSGNLGVTASNLCGSGGTNSMSVTITTSTPATPGAISGTNNLPTGVSGVAYIIPAVSGATSYTWTVPSGASIASGQGTTSIVVDYSCVAVSGNISVTANNDCGTSGARTLPVTVNAAPGQPGGISGISSVPQGSTAITYSIATVTGASTYNWVYTGTGATITAGQGTTSITVDFICGATNGNLTVNAANSCGTPSIDRVLGIAITGTLATPGAITGTGTPLFGATSIPYSVALVSGATTYTWTGPSGVTIASGQGTSSIFVDFSCTASNGNISVTVSNGCIGAGAPSNRAITMGSTITAPGAITGLNAVAQGRTGITYTIAPVTGATTYTWSYTGTGVTFPSGQGTTTVAADYACNATSGNISVTASNSCIGPSTANNLAVTVSTLATPGTITGLASVPQGSSGINYTILPIAGATSYTWIVPLGATIVAGQGSTSIWVDYGCTVGSGNILVTANNACGASGGSSLNVTISTNVPAQPGGISYPYWGPPPGTVNYICSIPPVTGATSYTWAVPAGAAITSGQGTTSVTIDFSCSAVTGNISVVANNACGTSIARTFWVSVTAIQMPGGISGTSSVPKGSSGLTYTTTWVPYGYASLIWTVPPGAIITSGQGTPTITVDFPCNSASGNIGVFATSPCGGQSGVRAFGVTITSSLSTLGVITGTTSPLYGQTGIPYSVAPIIGATTYTWSLPGDATVSTGQGTPSIGVDFPCTSVNGTIAVTASNVCSSTTPVSLSFALSSATLAQPSGITGAASVPKGTSGVGYSIPSVTGATNYTWTVPANCVITSGQGTTAIIVDFSDCSATSGNISVTAGNACVPTSPAKTLAVTVTSTALANPGTIIGTSTPQAGQSNLMYGCGFVSGANNYTWSYSGTGLTILSGQGTPNITVALACGATSGTLSVTASNGCVATSTVSTFSITPTGGLTTPGAIAGVQGPFYGQTGVVFSVMPVVGATTYTWTTSAGATIASGQGTNVISVDFSCTADLHGVVTVSTGNGCLAPSAVSALSYTMAGGLAAPGSIAGLTTVPKGTNAQVYSIMAIPSATSYTWSVPSGCTIVSGQGTRTIVVDFSCSAINDNITVSAANACETTGVSSLAITVTSVLSVPGVISGTTSPPQGSANNYIIVPVTGASTYNWTAPSGATLSTGAGTNSVSYNFDCAASNGNISVTANNACIAAGTASNLAITPIPAISIGTLGAITESIIPGAVSTRKYSVSSIGAAVYNWTVPTGMTITSGQGSNAIIVSISAAVSGMVSVTASNDCMTQSSSANLTVDVQKGVQFIATGTGQTGSMQTWTVPSGVTSITIEVFGAQGGTPTNYPTSGGKGARMKGTFTVTPGQILKILVGQQGYSNTHDGGGGGGTFVVDYNNNPMIIAGGGGGGGYLPSPGVDGTTSTSGAAGIGGCSGGIAGLGGGVLSTTYCGGGGGLYTDGAFGPMSGNAGLVGKSFLSGSTGGGTYTTATGGYGGGGGTHGQGWGGAGGGGYSGGGASGTSMLGGGGGGSYNTGTSQSNTSGVQTGHGKVIITW